MTLGRCPLSIFWGDHLAARVHAVAIRERVDAHAEGDQPRPEGALDRGCLPLLRARLSKVALIKFIAQKVFIKSLCKRQFPHKSDNLLIILVIIKDNLTDFGSERES